MLLERVDEQPQSFLLGAAGDHDGRIGDGGGTVEALFLHQIDFDAHRLSTPGHGKSATTRHASSRLRLRQDYRVALMPPSTPKVTPLSHLASSEARYTVA